MNYYELGKFIVEKSFKENKNIAVKIRIFNKTLFMFMPLNFTQDKENWLNRKLNTSQYFEMSTFDMHNKCNGDINLLHSKYGLDIKDFTLVAGAIPIINDNGCIGAIAVTGLLPEDDHNFLINAYNEFLNLNRNSNDL